VVRKYKEGSKKSGQVTALLTPTFTLFTNRALLSTARQTSLLILGTDLFYELRFNSPRDEPFNDFHLLLQS
jgi:hypothetical protein